MKTSVSISGPSTRLFIAFVAAIFLPLVVTAQTATTIIVTNMDVAYSETSKLLYVSNPTNSTLITINPVTGALVSSIPVSSAPYRLCASDGGQNIFAALNGVSTNHICQVNVNSQSEVAAWDLEGMYVDDMCPILGSPASVAVSRWIVNRIPRFGGVVIYDNGIARTNKYFPFLGSNVIEPSRSAGLLYGNNNESSPAGTQILHVDASGIYQTGGWSTIQGFGVDIFWRAGWIFATTGQILDPDRGVQVGSASFSSSAISDDAASGRYYLFTPNTLTAYDQNTLLPVGVNAFPGITASGNLIRCGTNRFALRMNSRRVIILQTPLISTGPPADLELSVSAPVTPIAVSNLFGYYMTVSNRGPNTAQNVVLTQALPSNASLVSAVSYFLTNSPVSGGWVSLPFTLAPGGWVSVWVVMSAQKPTLLTSTVSVTSDSLDPNLTNNVAKLESAVGQPMPRNSITEIPLPVNDLVWDKVSSRIFASIPNANWALGNSIVVLDPATGNFDPRIATPQEPGKLAVSDDGQYLYVGINSDASIQRINLSSRTLDIKFPTKIAHVADMAVLPGSPQTVVATIYRVAAVYDNGVMRSNTVDGNAYNSPSLLTLADANTVYEGVPTQFRRITINASGATWVYGSDSLLTSGDYRMRFDAGRLYTDGGRVIDATTSTIVTNLPYGGQVCPDSQSGKLFYLSVSGSTGTVHVLNITNLVKVGSITITNISGQVSSFLRWGADGLAFRTTGNQVFLIRTTFADDTDNDGLADSWELATLGTLGFNATDDPDFDGMNNRSEFFAGTDPNSADSTLRITGVTRQPGGLGLTWKAGTNVTYYLQRAASSTNPASWQDIYTNPATALNTGGFTDLTATNRANHYRLRVRTQ